MKITNVSKGKLVFAAGFSLAPGQSRTATEAEMATFNPVMVEAWKENKLITTDGEMPPAVEKSDADSAAEDAAKAKADAEAKAKATNTTNGAGKLPGAK